MQIVYIILGICAILLLINYHTHCEGFSPYDNCINQGYPYQWCLDSPRESVPCTCPAGQAVYMRHGICYCQSYAT